MESRSPDSTARPVQSGVVQGAGGSDLATEPPGTGATGRGKKSAPRNTGPFEGIYSNIEGQTTIMKIAPERFGGQEG